MATEQLAETAPLERPPEGIAETVSATSQAKRGRGRPPFGGSAAERVRQLGLGAELARRPATDRTKQNNVYFRWAVEILCAQVPAAERPVYAWLIPPEGDLNRVLSDDTPGPMLSLLRKYAPVADPERRRPLKRTVLAELGRLWEAVLVGECRYRLTAEETVEERAARAEAEAVRVVLSVARQLCELDPKPSVREAAAMVRRCRLEPARREAKPEAPGWTAWKLGEALAKFLDDYTATHAGVTREVQVDALEYLLGVVDHDEGTDGEEAAG